MKCGVNVSWVVILFPTIFRCDKAPLWVAVSVGWSVGWLVGLLVSSHLIGLLGLVLLLRHYPWFSFISHFFLKCSFWSDFWSDISILYTDWWMVDILSWLGKLENEENTGSSLPKSFLDMELCFWKKKTSVWLAFLELWLKKMKKENVSKISPFHHFSSLRKNTF